jgi:hypothetical protein
MSTRLKNLTACGGVISVYALVTLPILLTFPPPWPDEVILYSPAAALARGQGMGTAVLTGFLPGIDHYTYWQPPGYFFFLSLALRLVAPAHHFVAMRLFSWLLGVVALWRGAAILKRLAVGPGPAFVSLAVLATQVSFIQAANVGRMEMLTLASTLAALNCYLAYREKRRWRSLAEAGFLAGLAMLCHPAGILVPAVMVAHEVAAPRSGGKGVKEVLAFLGCVLVAFLPWFAYIAQAPGLFSTQMLAQSVRKSSYLGTVLTSGGYVRWLLRPFQDAIWPLGWSMGVPWPFSGRPAVIIQFLVLTVGLAALLAEGRRSVEASLLGTWALAGYGISLILPEIWYGIHFTTPGCLLLGWAVAGASRRTARKLALATLTLAAALNLDMARLLWHVNQDGSRRYQLYCSTLARMIPPNSSVLLAAIPDPYFGWLAEKKAYQVYEFVPEGVPVNEAQVEEALDKIDYVVGSACCRPDYLVNYLLAHGRAEVSLGERAALFPPVLLWKLRVQSNPPMKQKEGSRRAMGPAGGRKPAGSLPP